MKSFPAKINSEINIGILDSGWGGLSLVPALQKIQSLGPIKIHYLADKGYFPYGNKSPQKLTERIQKLSLHLIQRNHLDALILGCNTASTLCLRETRSFLNQQEELISPQVIPPVIGVVPAVKPAAHLTKNQVLGVLATQNTIDGPYLKELCQTHAPHCETILIPAPGLVEAAEAWVEDNTIEADPALQKHLLQILTPFTQNQPPPDTIVLGCTHFPLLKTLLKTAGETLWPKHQVRWVDSSEAIARRVESLMKEKLTLNQRYIKEKNLVLPPFSIIESKLKTQIERKLKISLESLVTTLL